MVTYRPSPRERQKAEKPSARDSRHLALNVAGFLTPAAAITVGIFAYTLSERLSEDPRPQNAAEADKPTSDPRNPAARSEFVPRQVTLAAERLATEQPAKVSYASVQSAPIAVQATKKPDGWQPAMLEPATPRIVARPLEEAPASQSELQADAIMQPLEPAIFSGIQTGPSLANSKLAKESFGPNAAMGGTQPAPLEEVQIEIVIEPEGNSEEAELSGSRFVRRDYSRTVRVAGSRTDTPIAKSELIRAQELRDSYRSGIPAVQEVREKMEALKNAHPRGALAKNTIPGQPTGMHTEKAMTGTVAPEAVILVEDELAWVQLGALLEVLESGIAAEEYTSLASSSAAGAFVSPSMLRDAGIDASYDASTQQLVLAAAG
ncbi:hypothetical protein KUW15_06285 [Qipengyuania aquimaris]|uniref:hypothetical protein n=1 Tax=Qipengyuania aquimaris TaxID=255984 RepID=UPI001C95DF49|nr:hypothetical protein [Qipengyuania aquimaris]MBY6128316.1 hypothetical protein [Qipengyuania aquimaris]